MINPQGHRYDATIDFRNRNDSHTLMAELAEGAARVLDVGCATGALGGALRNRGSYVVGVEIDPEAARIAEAALDEVVIGDIESPDFLRTIEQSFDCVIFGDVLEHLRDPLAVLNASRDLLSADGFTVISIPNIAHAAVRLSLLTGRFEYTPTGLLDETHLRFFTRSAVEELVRKAGYTIDTMERTTARTFETEIPLDPEVFSESLLAAIESSDEAQTYQFVLRARPQTEGVLGQPALGGSPGPRWDRLRRDESAMQELLTTAVAEVSARFDLEGEMDLPDEVPPVYYYGADAASDPELYQNWLHRTAPERMRRRAEARARLKSQTDLPSITVLVPVFQPELGLLRKCVDSVRSQTLESWQLCLCDDGSHNAALATMLSELADSDPRITVVRRNENGGISAATNSAAAVAAGDFLAFLDQDDELEPGVLAEVVLALADNPDADVLYTDEDKLDEHGKRLEPYFKPDWSPDHLLSNMYLCHLLVVRRTLFERLGGLRSEFDGSQDYDLALRATEQSPTIIHLATVGYHWRKIAGSTAQDYRSKPHADAAARAALRDAMARRGVKANIESGLQESTFRVRRIIDKEPLVSIIVPFHNGAELLRRCIESLQTDAGYNNWEAILVDNRSWEPETQAVLARLAEDERCRVVDYAEHFNWAALNNYAVKQADGKHILFLNADVQSRTSGWLSAMVEHSERPEVGAVGARLLYPDGRIQHAGVVMGLGGGVAGHAFCFCPPGRHGYFHLDQIIRNYSAVTGACMMVRREVFDLIGGFDEQLTVAYNDIDFCLRLRKMGYLNVYTPFAELMHEESAARGRASREYAETAIMFRRWEDLIRGDPYFNPNLDPLRHEFSLFFGLEEDDPWERLASAAEKWLKKSGVK